MGPLDSISIQREVEDGQWVALGQVKDGDASISLDPSSSSAWSSEPMVVHLPKRDGGKVEITTLSEFCSKENADVIYVPPIPDTWDGAESVRRALSCVGVPGYNAAFSNCEHFARFCSGQSVSSPQAIHNFLPFPFPSFHSLHSILPLLFPSIHSSLHPSIHPSIHAFVPPYLHTYIPTYLHFNPFFTQHRCILKPENLLAHVMSRHPACVCRNLDPF